jgi:hypothetical protein
MLAPTLLLFLFEPLLIMYHYLLPFSILTSVIYNIYDGLTSKPNYFFAINIDINDNIYVFSTNNFCERIFFGLLLGLVIGVTFPTFIMLQMIGLFKFV